MSEKMSSEVTVATQPPADKPRSMHDRVASWCDCCTCEAEPRWAALADQLGIDMSDYEPARDDNDDARPDA